MHGIRQNPSTKLRLPQLAAKVDMSVRRLEQLFVEEIGMTYVAFSRQIKMDHARRLLISSSKSINEISSSIGYATAYFCREFRKVNGCTAVEFRQHARNTGV
jgi:LacI family transcriptional regulator